MVTVVGVLIGFRPRLLGSNITRRVVVVLRVVAVVVVVVVVVLVVVVVVVVVAIVELDLVSNAGNELVTSLLTVVDGRRLEKTPIFLLMMVNGT